MNSGYLHVIPATIFRLNSCQSISVGTNSPWIVENKNSILLEYLYIYIFLLFLLFLQIQIFDENMEEINLQPVLPNGL